MPAVLILILFFQFIPILFSFINNEDSYHQKHYKAAAFGSPASGYFSSFLSYSVLGPLPSFKIFAALVITPLPLALTLAAVLRLLQKALCVHGHFKAWCSETQEHTVCRSLRSVIW